jgi:hypothetical protein
MGRTLCWSSPRNVKGILLRITSVLEITITRAAAGRDTPAGGIIRHHQVREAAFRDIVEKVLLPDICELAIVWWYL